MKIKINSVEELKTAINLELQISTGVNLFDELSCGSKPKWFGKWDKDINLKRYLKNLNRTLDHFKVDALSRSDTGDLLIRFGLWYAEQNGVVAIPDDSEELNRIADLWEYFNKLEW